MSFRENGADVETSGELDAHVAERLQKLVALLERAELAGFAGLVHEADMRLGRERAAFNVSQFVFLLFMIDGEVHYTRSSSARSMQDTSRAACPRLPRSKKCYPGNWLTALA